MIPSSARSLDGWTGTAARQVSGDAALRPMRVLLINQYFPPDTAATAKMALLVARALARRASVRVLAGRPSYEPAERHRPYFWRRERQGNVFVERVGSTVFSRHRMP